MTSIELLDGDAAAPYADRIFALYDAVFGRFPDIADWREQLFDRDRKRNGYRLVLALDGDRVLGFAWGYRGERGQHWPDLVARTLPELPAEWFRDHFELVELAVDPDARRQGIGVGLHDALLDGLTGRALLGTTLAPDDPALRLYKARGWSTLGHLANNRQVMGAYLPLPHPPPRHQPMARIGGRLHDALLDGIIGTALLATTNDDSNPAVRLYRSRGWQRLGLLDPQRQVMGVERH